MPAFLDAGDRRLVIGAVALMLVLLGVAYVLQPPQRQQSIGIPSTYSSDWLGAKAAFLLLQQSGYHVERWLSPPNELPEQAAGVTLIFAEPDQPSSPADRAAVASFVAAGGRLLVMGAHGAAFAPEAAAFEIPSPDLTPYPYPALLPSPLSRNAPDVTMVAPDGWRKLAPGQLAVYGKNGSPAVVWYRFGKGQVIWWAISSPMSNGSLRDKDNVALFLNSVGPKNSRILWDEYFHGMRRSLGSYFANTPLPWAGVQVAVVFVAMLLTFSRRSGPVRMPAMESRLSPLEFVDTLGDLYQSAHAAAGTVGVEYQRLRTALARRLALRANVKLPDLARAAATRFGWPEEALFQTLLQSERAMRDFNLDDGHALELVQQLHEYAARLETAQRSQDGAAWR